MPTVRAIKVKLRVNGRDFNAIRRGLWKTHSLTNQGVRYYAHKLILMRQENLFGVDQQGKQICIKTADQCRAELLEWLRKRQEQNRHDGPKGSELELLALLRSL